jgi:hypothetical protein
MRQVRRDRRGIEMRLRVAVRRRRLVRLRPKKRPRRARR